MPAVPIVGAMTAWPSDGTNVGARQSDAEGVRLADLLLAGGLLALGFVGTGEAGADQPGSVAPDALAYVLVTAAFVPLVWWRRLPVLVLGVTAAATAAYLALGYPFGPILFAIAVAAGGVGARRPLRTVTVPAALLELVVLAGAAASWLVRAGPPAAVGVGGAVTLLAWACVWLALPFAIGVAVRVRGEANARLRAERARRAVSEERLAMAQEVHDVVGHGLAVIAMQAGVGLHVLDRNPLRAREALEAIRSTSTEALDGLRAELETMRGRDVTASRRPGAGLSEVPALVERVRSAGVDVRLDLDAADEVPEHVDLAAYRIVQESLTNVLRHAGSSAAAHVVARRGDDGQLHVDVTDSGRGPALGALGDGSGIAGMRERATQLGGTLDASSGPGGGFAVRARLPLTTPDHAPDHPAHDPVPARPPA